MIIFSNYILRFLITKKIIGKKISSTLASVGTSSFYVDASSCSHGDLGKIGANDILILIHILIQIL